MLEQAAADAAFSIRQYRQLTELLEVSERTIYRDVADLIGSGTPIDGEAGIGYRLRREYRLPPLQFSEDELTPLARLRQAMAGTHKVRIDRRRPHHAAGAVAAGSDLLG